MAEKINRTVVRNQAYSSGSFNVRERHNKRKNECYGNGDIDPARADMNIHFRRVMSPDGTPETYEQTYKRLLCDKIIVQRGQKKDGTAKVFDELIFDVNTAYFENNGGYDYAKSFFEEAYRLAVNEIGGEQFILSAVMHADEKNKALSDELGRDAYHYHLHVVYVPVVKKEVYFNKDNKNSELAGKLKEVITQISHSKKWPIKVPVERGGKTIMVNSYSLLQDRFFDHMRTAGFDGFERGERGSTAEHLSDIEYKTQQEKERAAAFSAAADAKEKEIQNLDSKKVQKQKQITDLDKKLDIRKKAEIDTAELDSIGSKKNLMGQHILTQDELKKAKRLASEGMVSRGRIYELEYKLNRSNHDGDRAIKERDDWKSRYQDLYEKTKPFLDAIRHAPRKVMEFLSYIMRQPREISERDHDRDHNQQRRKTYEEVR